MRTEPGAHARTIVVTVSSGGRVVRVGHASGRAAKIATLVENGEVWGHSEPGGGHSRSFAPASRGVFCGVMNRITHSPHAARPSPAELAEFARKLKDLGPESGLYPGTIVSIDAGHLSHSLGTGADLALPSYVATGDDLDLFTQNVNPAFFYSWDVHPEQQPDWFRVSARFTPSDFGIGDTRSYEVEWVVLPFFLDLGAELTLEASPNPGPGAGSSTLGEFAVFTLSMAVGPIEPNETLHADLIRNSRNGSWIWLRTNITYLPPTRAPM
jgi:hypothetical protein